MTTQGAEGANLIRVEAHKINRYKTIDLQLIESVNDLSWKAKGLWVYLISRPPGWKMHFSDLVNRSKDGRDAVTAGLKELREKGYLAYEYLRDSQGHWSAAIWIVRETPQIEGEAPASGKPVSRETRAISSKQKDNREQERKKHSSGGSSIEEPPSEYAGAYPEMTASSKAKALREDNSTISQKARVGYVTDVLLGLPDRSKRNARELLAAAGGKGAVYKLVVVMLTKFPVDFLVDFAEERQELPMKEGAPWDKYLMGALYRQYEQWRITQEEIRYQQELKEEPAVSEDILAMARKKLVPRWGNGST